MYALLHANGVKNIILVHVVAFIVVWLFILQIGVQRQWRYCQCRAYGGLFVGEWSRSISFGTHSYHLPWNTMGLCMSLCVEFIYWYSASHVIYLGEFVQTVYFYSRTFEEIADILFSCFPAVLPSYAWTGVYKFFISYVHMYWMNINSSYLMCRCIGWISRPSSIMAKISFKDGRLVAIFVKTQKVLILLN
jgi:hypothetical protein